jgi:ataxia telangiectasia mutated family protein
VDIRRGVVSLTRNVSIDERESDNLKRQRDKYLKLALSNYGSAIERADHSEAEERSTFRLVALWFENMSTDWIGGLVSGLLARAPTFRFVPLLSQLSARLGDKEHLQKSVLRSFVVRCASEHPYHALPILMALVNADDSAYATGKQTIRVIPSTIKESRFFY